MTEYRLIGIILIDSGMIKIELENVKTCDITAYQFNSISEIEDLEFLGYYTIETECENISKDEIESKARKAISELPKGTTIKIPFVQKAYFTNAEIGLVHEAKVEEVITLSN